MSEIIVEVNVENGLPGTKWGLGERQDARYLLAVVYELKAYQKLGINLSTVAVPGIDKFVARWEENGYVKLTIPYVDGDHWAFIFVLTRTLESIAKIKIEMDWGAKFLKRMMTQSKIAVPNPPGGQLAL